ncbi:MAG: hypothetical protein ACTSVI_02095 [Promethearchaeota archaeon]
MEKRERGVHEKGELKKEIYQGRKVPRAQVIVYGFMVDFRNISGIATSMYGFSYLIDIFALRLDLYFLASSIFLFYNALNDVIFGIYADRVKFKEGVGFDQPPLALFGIRFMYFFLNAIAGLLLIISIKPYPFKGKKLIELKRGDHRFAFNKEKNESKG